MAKTNEKAILDEMRAFREEWKKESSELKGSIDLFMGRIEQIEETQEQLKARVKELTKEKEEIKAKLNFSEQYHMKGNVVIVGIPDKGKGEDVLATVKEIGKKLSVEIDKYDVAIAHRIPSKSNKPPIIVRFNNWFKKDELVEGSKALRRSINNGETEEIDNPFFVNEQLTEYTADLFKEARLLREEGRLEYAWSKNGKVFGKLYESLETIKIRDYTDIENIRMRFQPQPRQRSNSHQSETSEGSAYARNLRSRSNRGRK